MERFDQRQGFLISALVHLMILMMLAQRPPVPRPFVEPTPAPPEPPAERVFLPPVAVLRQLVPVLPPAAVPRPMPAPTPPPEAKDRVSIGQFRDERQRVFRAEDDWTKAPKGTPDRRAEASRLLAGPESPVSAAGLSGANEGRPGFAAPARGGKTPAGEGGSVTKGQPSIAQSLRNLEQRLGDGERLGLPSGTAQQVGPLLFDPQGADFTVWINHWKNEIFRNWIPPQPALMGLRGHVDLEVSIERDGTVSRVVVLKSSGIAAFDRAAQNALVASRFLPLPDDYGPPRLVGQLSFHYNEGPAES